MALIRVTIESIIEAADRSIGVFDHSSWLRTQNPKNICMIFECLPGEDPEIDAVPQYAELDANRNDPIVPGKQVLVLPKQLARNGAVIGIRTGSAPFSVQEER